MKVCKTMIKIYEYLVISLRFYLKQIYDQLFEYIYDNNKFRQSSYIDNFFQKSSFFLLI